jgi:zinc finger CCCH domain-containing protein 13
MYIIINESERERDRERERERERGGEKESERERPNTIIRQKKLPRQFSRLLTPVPSLSVFIGNLPQGASSLMFIMGER